MDDYFACNNSEDFPFNWLAFGPCLLACFLAIIVFMAIIFWLSVYDQCLIHEMFAVVFWPCSRLQQR